jgi:two-component system response regulator
MFRTLMPTILLAEDSDNDAEMVIDAFKEANLANPIVRVHDGVEVLEFLRRQGKFADRAVDRPIVVLLDLQMPRLGGIETLTQIRADPEHAQLPVVILTSSREESDAAASWNLGVNAFVIKPVEPPQFLAALKVLGKFWAVINETPPTH